MFEYSLNVCALKLEPNWQLVDWYFHLTEIGDVELVDPFLVAFVIDCVHGLYFFLVGVVVAVTKVFEPRLLSGVEVLCCCKRNG